MSGQLNVHEATYKISNASRNERKLIKATNYDELLKKVSISLKMEIEKLVDEDEGYEISSETLNDFKEKKIMVLGPDEVWTEAIKQRSSSSIGPQFSKNKSDYSVKNNFHFDGNKIQNQTFNS